MRSFPVFIMIALTSGVAVAANYLPFNHRGPGFGVCRSFISMPGRGDIPHWSDIFETSASGYDLKPSFEAFISANFGSAGRIYSGTFFKTATRAHAQALRNDSMYSAVAVSTRWRPSASDLPQSASAESSPLPRKNATALSPRLATNPPPATKGPTPNQLKYQRELAAHNQRLAEIERIKRDTAARHGASKQAAQQQLAGHNQEMARHRQEVAAAAERQRRHQEEVAAHQRLVDQMQRKTDRERKVDWREAVVVCELKASDGQSRFGNWRCEGPLQMTYAKLGTAGAGLNKQNLVALSQACGGREESVRDLGMVGVARLFGCSFGLNPASPSAQQADQARRHGITFVPGRAIYRCATYVSYCRTQ